MELDDLIRHVRERDPNPAAPTAAERERIFRKASDRLRGDGWLDLAHLQAVAAAPAPAPPWRRAVSIGTAAAVILVLAAVGISLAVHSPGGGHTATGHSGTTTASGRHGVGSGRRTGPLPARLARECASAPRRGTATAYVLVQTTSSSAEIAEVSLPSGRTDAIWPVNAEAIAVSPATGILYAVVSTYPTPGSDFVQSANQVHDSLVAIDPATRSRRTVARWRGAAPFSDGLAISPNGRYALVAETGASAIYLPGLAGHAVEDIDLHHPSTHFTIRTPGRYADPWGIAFAPSGAAFVTDGRLLLKVDARTHSVTGTIPLPDRVGKYGFASGDIAISPAGTSGLVGSHGADLFLPAPVIQDVSLPAGTRRDIREPHQSSATGPIAYDCSGSAAFAVTTYGIIRVAASGRVEPVTGTDTYGPDLAGLAALPGTRQIWMTDSIVSGASTRTELIPLSGGSLRAGTPVGNLNGSAIEIVLAPSRR